MSDEYELIPCCVRLPDDLYWRLKSYCAGTDRQLAKVVRRAIDAWLRENDVAHRSDCALHNRPAYPASLCDCGVYGAAGEEP